MDSPKPVATQTSWLISVGHKTKQEGVNVRREALEGRRCNRGKREVSTGHREGKQKVCANVIDENRVNKNHRKIERISV